MIRRQATMLTQVPIAYETLKKELSNDEIEMLILWVKNVFRVSNTEESLGLPYTSSSGMGALWVTNQELIIADPDDKFIQGFSIDNQDRIIVLTHTKDETEYWYTYGRRTDDKTQKRDG